MKRRGLLNGLLAFSLICAPVSFADGGPAVKGNRQSKIYHVSTCRHYSAKGSTEEFKSATEAEKAGYRACKLCGEKNPNKTNE